MNSLCVTNIVGAMLLFSMPIDTVSDTESFLEPSFYGVEELSECRYSYNNSLIGDITDNAYSNFKKGVYMGYRALKLNTDEVTKTYIKGDKALDTLVNEATREIGKFFDNQTKLEVEREEKNEGLFLNIVVDMDVSIASKKFDDFCDSWWLDNMDRAEYQLHIGMRFV